MSITKSTIKSKFLGICELAVTSLFAVVFSFIASKVVHSILSTSNEDSNEKKKENKHPFNHTETFLTGYLTAMIMFIMIRCFDWRTGLKQSFN